MNLGKTILEFRKSKNVTQEELAAQLGVTAAAVSKWENGYTLPDILMLSALADFFEVTTDELLGRKSDKKYAVILADNMELGEKIDALIAEFHFEPCGIFTDEASALAAAEKDSRIQYIVVGNYENGFFCDTNLQVIVSCHATDESIIDGLKWALENCVDDDGHIRVLN